MIGFEMKRRKHSSAQAMVEFALVLPILILLLYGLIEVGHLIFVYSTVVSASREAVRYGSATGINISGGVVNYQDCTGIVAAAQNVDFLDAIQDEHISISYDHGPGTSSFSNCPPTEVETGDRIEVQISAQYVPFTPLIPITPKTLISSSARTILVGIPVMGNATPVPPP